jgi:NitT/TauT family transport system substrate-binding protein
MIIRIGHLSTFYHTAVLLMAQRTANERLGAEVEWKLMGTGPAIMKAFQSGELDMAYIGLPPAIIGICQGINVLCVAGGHVEGTVLAGKPQWKAFPEAADLGTVLTQFRGRKIGVPGKGSIHDVILKDSIEQQGLKHEIEIVNFPWADLVTEAVVKNEVAAAMGTPALAIAINRFAGGKVLYPSSKLWPNNPSYGIVVANSFLERERERVEKFLVLHEEATAFIRKEPVKAAQVIANFVSIVDADFVRDTFMISPKYCAKLTEDYISATMKFIPILKKLGYIQTQVPKDRIFSLDLINKIHPGPDHYNEGISVAG